MVQIIPKPMRCEELGGSVPFNRGTLLTGAFQELFDGICSMLPPVKDDSQNQLCFVKEDGMEKESYRIACGTQDIQVTASDKAGAFYAVISLLQLCSQAGTVPRVNIFDKPRFSYRGFMLDCARHFWPVDKIKSLLDFMAFIKLNAFHWHITDDQGWRIEIEKYPLLTQKGTVRIATDKNENCTGHYFPETIGQQYGAGLFYTKAEAREIVAYAAERGIEVIPEVDMPGHLSAAIACYPQLSCTGDKIEVPDEWGVLHHIGCPGKEFLFTFAKDIIDELCEIFPSQYFHIGGDEVLTDSWESCPDCQRLMQEENLATVREVQGYFNGILSEYLASKGKRLVGWNEILNSAFASPDKMVGQWWIDSKTEIERDWINRGGKMILSFCDYMYMDHPYSVRPLAKTYNFEPDVLKIKKEQNIIGIEVPQWTEHILTTEKLDMYTNARLLAAAELAWTDKEGRDYAEFESRIEGMRGLFQSYGFMLAPRQMYTGKIYREDADEHIREMWEIWQRKDRDFEMNAWKALEK